jgi:manganese-dependent inorganic pyrophosphatase
MKKLIFALVLMGSFILQPLISHANDEATYVVGHLAPDSDAICAAFAAAELYGSLPGDRHYPALPVRVGELNKETAFILQHFGVTAMPLMEDFSDKKKIILVDHNERSQRHPTINPENVVAIIDHHKLNFASSNPIEITVRPWGSACTILAKEFLDKERFMPTHIAGLCLGALLSDTLNLKGPTTTPIDHEVAKKLAEIAGIQDIDAFAHAMFKAKSDLSDVSAQKIFTTDFKVTEMGSSDQEKSKVGFGVAETLNPESLLKRKAEFLEKAEQIKKEKGVDLLFFAVVDIDQQNSYLLILGDKEGEVAQKAFGGKIANGILKIPGKVSRKLDFFPALIDSFKSFEKQKALL